MIVVDEIQNIDVLRKLGEQEFPASVRLVLILNPKKFYTGPLLLPSSIHHVTLSTPYRSTVAITSLARFIAKCKGLVVPEGDFGSDVEGTKPIFFDVGNDERKMEEALEHCHKQLGDNATILYNDFLPSTIEKMAREQGKEAGGSWECYRAQEFCGLEAEQIVVVTSGWNIMKQITRAKTRLSVILVDGGYSYTKAKKYLQQAADLGLVETVQLTVD